MMEFLIFFGLYNTAVNVFVRAIAMPYPEDSASQSSSSSASSCFLQWFLSLGLRIGLLWLPHLGFALGTTFLSTLSSCVLVSATYYKKMSSLTKRAAQISGLINMTRRQFDSMTI